MLEHLYRALRSPSGISLRTNDVEKLRQKLYRVRKESGDSDLDVLSFRPSPTNPDGELWIVKKVSEDATSKQGSDE